MIRIVISGIGNRALPRETGSANWLGWVEQIKRSRNFKLVAAHDISKESLSRVVKRSYLKSREVYSDLDTMLKEVKCDAILVSNPADCHALTINKAIGHNLSLLIEKPFVRDLRQGYKLVELIKRKKLTAAVIQNWRCKEAGKSLYEFIQSGKLGRIGQIFFRYIRNRENPNYPAYIFEEKHPLLYAMGIHHLDLFRYILRDEFKSVSGHSFKPPWSLYKSDTGINLFLKTMKNTSVIYSGTISSRNSIIPQESLIIEGEEGTLLNESQWLEPPLWFYPKGKKKKLNLTRSLTKGSVFAQYNISDEYILENFYRTIIGKEEPVCTVSDGLSSVNALEASRIACGTGKTVYLDPKYNFYNKKK